MDLISRIPSGPPQADEENDEECVVNKIISHYKLFTKKWLRLQLFQPITTRDSK